MINPFIIIKEVEAYFKLQPGVLTSNDKHRNIHRCRAICMFIIKEACHLNNVEIGKYFNRDHASVYRILRWLYTTVYDEDTKISSNDKPKIKDQLEEIKEQINEIILRDINLIWG